jgi:hypothetical protein
MAQGCYVRKTTVSSQDFPPLEAGGTEVAKTGELGEHGKTWDLLVLKRALVQEETNCSGRMRACHIHKRHELSV